MSNKVRTQKSVESILNLLLLLILSISYFILLRIFFTEEIVFFAKGYVLIMVLYAVILSMFMKIYGGGKLSFSKISDLMWSISLSVFFTSVIAYIQNSLIANYLLNPFYAMLITIIQIIIGCIVIYLEWKFLYQKFPAKNTLLIYETDYHAVLEKLKKNGDLNFNFKEIVSVKEKHLSEIMEKVYLCDYILILDIDEAFKRDIVKECYNANKSVYLIPVRNEIVLNNAESLHLIDTPLLSLNKFGPSQLQKTIKRFFDILLSFMALIIFLPIMGIVSIFIKLGDGGPVLYKQVRLTQYGRKFMIYKFRSMKVNAEKDGIALTAKEGDDRITPVGKIIREFRLDELPQLLNILMGDMSIVGPRPERPEIAEKIYGELPEFENRLKVKAGLTGYAQVYGKYNTSLKDKLLLDLMYIENYSLFLDFKIILMTIKTIFIKESTEGF